MGCKTQYKLYKNKLSNSYCRRILWRVLCVAIWRYILCISLLMYDKHPLPRNSWGTWHRRGCVCICVCMCIFVCLHARMCDRAADLFLAVSNLHITIMFYNPTFSKPLPLLSSPQCNAFLILSRLEEAQGQSLWWLSCRETCKNQLGQIPQYWLMALCFTSLFIYQCVVRLGLWKWFVLATTLWKFYSTGLLPNNLHNLQYWSILLNSQIWFSGYIKC